MDTVSVRHLPRHRTAETGLSEGTFVQLYQHQLQRVLNYVRYRLGAGEAEDVTADIFARTWARRREYDPSRGTPETWLWAIARNATRDRLRLRRPVQLPLSFDLPAAHDPSADAGRREEWQHIQAALDRLAPVDREIISLRFGAGQTNRAIAALLEISEANVAQRLRRALQRMRICLQGGDLL